ncbi:MAG: indole acetimide hydrolase, partial [Emcibacter sp.]|nr:indole acetimide hydrolase [Emcibacter sp.]
MTILDLTTTEVVAALRQGDMTVSDYVTALTRQIKDKSGLNAFITFDEDLLGAQAVELDRRRAAGEDCGALFGLPIAVKDNIETAVYVTTGGTGALKNHRPSHNAPFLQKLLDQGALVLGKTNLHELAFGITSNNSVFGPVRNPYNPDMIAGGSSGGSAAAVAARMAPFAIGTDTGGSTRIPPALCGITGFRPTMGRYGADGAVPIAHTRATMGTMARTGADIPPLDQG